MVVLVTGGAGFIGSHFVRYLLEAHSDDRVICFDKLTYAGNLASLSSVMDHPNFRFVHADICDGSAVARVFKEDHPDAVVNFAAETHVDRSIDAPDVFLRTNVLGTAVLLDACRKYGIVRYHQISTDEVYGDLPLDRPDLLFTEQSPLRASSPYAASKASADLLVLSYHRTYGLPVSISRSSNNYGAYQFPEKLIPLMIANAVEGRSLPVYGDGLNTRDWLFVEDHCAAIDLILRRGRVGEVYNVGAENEISNITLVKMICRMLGKSEELITYVRDRQGHDRRYAVDASKLRGELGWSPKKNFSDGISETVRWYLENTEWRETVASGAYRAYYEKIYENR